MLCQWLASGQSPLAILLTLDVGLSHLGQFIPREMDHVMKESVRLTGSSRLVSSGENEVWLMYIKPGLSH